jgi:long-subunit acyl-CoA synthetase (AMP-forming)
MKPFSRVKDFVRNHQNKVSFVAGVAVVIVIAELVIMKSAKTGIILKVSVTPEQLQHLLQNPESVISFGETPSQIVWVTNSTTKEIFP